jgi:hypothetical protein
MWSPPPKAATVASTTRRGNPASVTSPATAMHRSPEELRMKSAVASAAEASRSLTVTNAPWAANRMAAARPMPDPAPVMMATWLRSRLPGSKL